MKLPPYGLCLPSTFVRARDGDTIVVQVRRGGFKWVIRLADCWVTDDKRSPVYRQALELVQRECGEASDEGRLAVFLAIDQLPENPLRAVSFDRLIGLVFLDTETTLGELLIRKGLAGARKGEEPR